MGGATIYNFDVIEKTIGELYERLLRKYEGNVKVTEYDYSLYKRFLKENYDCLEVDLTESEKYIFRHNFERNTNAYNSNICLITFQIVQNEKSKKLYDNLFCYEDITVKIEVNTGYFETNSVELFELLTLVKGVSQEDVDKKTNAYKDYLFCLNKHNL